MINQRQIDTQQLQLKAKHVWAHGFFIGIFLGALAFFVYFYSATMSFLSPKTSQTLVEAKSESPPTPNPEISPPVLSDPVANLQLQLTRVFDGIRETNQHKDLIRLMGFYSQNFPGLSKKSQSIKQSWGLYDYQKMDFNIHGLNLLAEDSVEAWVTWDVVLKELSTNKIINYSKKYKVTFIKESGQWNIIALKNAL